jgi:hypothetical protein
MGRRRSAAPSADLCRLERELGRPRRTVRSPRGVRPTYRVAPPRGRARLTARPLPDPAGRLRGELSRAGSHLRFFEGQPRTHPTSFGARDRQIGLRFLRRDETGGSYWLYRGVGAVRLSFDVVGVMDGGQNRVATFAQCAEVERLSRQGASVRAVAKEVFGDVRFRGRVERILRTAVPAAPLEAAYLDDVAGSRPPAETVPAVRAALSRYSARVERGELQPSLAELLKLLDLERRLRAFESLERMNASTRAAAS